MSVFIIAEAGVNHNGCLLYTSIRQPLFSDFDEFSFWGTAAKLTKVNDTLYTECEVGWAWQATQNPGLITLSYFLQFLGSFAPWKVYLAYDALLFACFGAVLGATGWKKYENAVALGLICWCVPWFFTTYCRTIYLKMCIRDRSEVNRLLGDSTKLRQLTGWAPKYTFAQGLAETIAFLRDNLNKYKPDTYLL